MVDIHTSSYKLILQYLIGLSVESLSQLYIKRKLSVVLDVTKPKETRCEDDNNSLLGKRLVF